MSKVLNGKVRDIHSFFLLVMFLLNLWLIIEYIFVHQKVLWTYLMGILVIFVTLTFELWNDCDTKKC